MNAKLVQVSLVVVGSILAAHQQANAETAPGGLHLKSTVQQVDSVPQTPKVKQVVALLQSEGIETFTRSNYIPKDCQSPNCYECSGRGPQCKGYR